MIQGKISVSKLKELLNENEYKIVLYGFGVIGKISAPFFLKEHGVWESVLFFVDNDKNKQGKKKLPNGELVEVNAPEKMKEIKCNFIVLVTGSRYEGILKYLHEQRYLNNVRVYVLPEMLISEKKINNPVIRKYEKMIIPPLIHYFWFGKMSMPNEMKKWMESWKKYCPNYEIIEWNESNYDVKKFSYMKQAYENKKWAFVTDIARLDILYNYGGIYLDTDVELINNIDALRYCEGFCSTEKWGIVNTGGGCGAIKKHPMIGEMLEYRVESQFINDDGTINMESSGSYETIPCMRRGFIPNNKTQLVNRMVIYSSEYFHPYDYMTRTCTITDNTFGIHHFAGSWTK